MVIIPLMLHIWLFKKNVMLQEKLFKDQRSMFENECIQDILNLLKSSYWFLHAFKCGLKHFLHLFWSMEIIKNHWDVKSLKEGNILRLIFNVINIWDVGGTGAPAAPSPAMAGGEEPVGKPASFLTSKVSLWAWRLQIWHFLWSFIDCLELKKNT